MTEDSVNEGFTDEAQAQRIASLIMAEIRKESD